MILFKAQVAKHIFPDIVKDVDGYWKWGSREYGGLLTEEELLMIALLLKEANRLWDQSVKAFFA